MEHEESSPKLDEGKKPQQITPPASRQPPARDTAQRSLVLAGARDGSVRGALPLAPTGEQPSDLARRAQAHRKLLSVHGPVRFVRIHSEHVQQIKREKKNQHPTTPQVPNLLFGDISFRRVLLTRTQAAAALRGRGNLQHSRRTPLRDAREGTTTPTRCPPPGRGRGWRFPGAKGSSPTASSLFQSRRTPPTPHSMQLFSLCLTPICVLWHYNCCSHRHKQRRFPLQNPHMF